MTKDIDKLGKAVSDVVSAKMKGNDGPEMRRLWAGRGDSFPTIRPLSKCMMIGFDIILFLEFSIINVVGEICTVVKHRRCMAIIAAVFSKFIVFYLK